MKANFQETVKQKTDKELEDIENKLKAIRDFNK